VGMSQLYLPHELSSKVLVRLGATVQISRKRFSRAFPFLSSTAQDIFIHFT